MKCPGCRKEVAIITYGSNEVHCESCCKSYLKGEIYWYWQGFKDGAKEHSVQSDGLILSEFCQDCKEEFGHPDNCIGCDHASTA